MYVCNYIRFENMIDTYVENEASQIGIENVHSFLLKFC